MGLIKLLDLCMNLYFSFQKLLTLLSDFYSI